jgi:hypothetical protein
MWNAGCLDGGNCGLGDYIIEHVLHMPMPVVELLLAALAVGRAGRGRGGELGSDVALPFLPISTRPLHALIFQPSILHSIHHMDT